MNNSTEIMIAALSQGLDDEKSKQRLENGINIIIERNYGMNDFPLSMKIMTSIFTRLVHSGHDTDSNLDEYLSKLEKFLTISLNKQFLLSNDIISTDVSFYDDLSKEFELAN